MPSIVGNIKINNVSQSSNVQIGDVATIVLTSSSKNYGGASSFCPGDAFGSVSSNQNSSTNTNDPDEIDNTNSTIV
jgi:spore germination protein PA